MTLAARYLMVCALCLATLALGGCGGGGGGDENSRSVDTTRDGVFAYSGDVRVDALLTPPDLQLNWNFVAPGRGLTYSFDATAASGRLTNPFAFNSAQREATVNILRHATALTGISFSEATNPQQADIYFAWANSGGFGQTFFSDVQGRPPVYIALNSANLANPSIADAFGYLTPVPGTQAYLVLLHEIGHALGLKHPFEIGITNSPSENVLSNTVMTLLSGSGGPVLPSVFQPYDQLALKWIYGGDGLGGERGFNSRLGPSL